jgi:hypothetical protein
VIYLGSEFRCRPRDAGGGAAQLKKSDVRGGEPDIAKQILGQRREYDRGASN